MVTKNFSAIDYKTLRREVEMAGFLLLHVTSEVLGADARERLIGWQNQGYAAELGYMKRDPNLFVDFRKIFPAAKSLVSLGVRYSLEPESSPPSGVGRVARYAWGRDYHKVIKKNLKKVGEALKLESGCEAFEVRNYADALPLLERAYAEKGQQGFIGRNSMFIVPGRGSFLFLAEMLLSHEIQNLPSSLTSIRSSGCGTCARCMDSCPTGAIVEDFVVDSRRCISYLTIEKRGHLTNEEREMIGDWIFGCDICQNVCPFNHAPLKLRKPIVNEAFLKKSGVGSNLQLDSILKIRDDKHFQEIFAGTALMRAKREGLLRNAAVVAGNTKCESCSDALKECVVKDSSPVVRAHAVWALGRIWTRDCFDVDFFKECLRREKDEEVRTEIEFLLNPHTETSDERT